MEEFGEHHRLFIVGEHRHRLQPELEIPVACALFGKRLELNQQRGHQVECELHVRELAQQRDHPVVVLERVQPHPREDVLACGEILVVRLMHVPEKRDVGHVVSSAKTN